MANNLAVKIRKNKNGISYYCNLWHSKKKNSVNITLGKHIDKVFTASEALQKMEKIKNLFKQGIYDYKYHLDDSNNLDLVSSKLTLNDVADIYYNHREEKLKSKFKDAFTHTFNLTELSIDENTQYNKKLRSLNSNKSFYDKYVRVLEWDTIFTKKKSGEISKVKKRIGIKTYREFGLKPFKYISKQDIIEFIKEVDNLPLAKKTQVNILGQLRTIINHGIEKYELVDMKNPFNTLPKETRKDAMKDPKHKRNRILQDEELQNLFKILYSKPNKNAFVGALMGFCFTLRASSVLSIRKQDFSIPTKPKKLYYYDRVNLLSLKTSKKYILPIPKFLGKFLYQYLLDYDLDEYVLRAKRPSDRKKAPLMSISQDYYDIVNELFFYSDTMQKDKKELDATTKALSIIRHNLSQLRHKKGFEHEYEVKKADFVELKELERISKDEIQDALVTRKKDKDLKNKDYFDFHSLRHQSGSYIAKINFLYAKFCLAHSSMSREDETSLRYIKIDEVHLEETLNSIYEPLLFDIIKETAEYKLYLKQELSHKAIYNEQHTTKHEDDGMVEDMKRKRDLILGASANTKSDLVDMLDYNEGFEDEKEKWGEVGRQLVREDELKEQELLKKEKSERSK